MKLRWRLVLALVLAGILPLVPLYVSVRYAIQTGARTLAPRETGEALRAGFELARDRLAEASEEKRVRVELLSRLLSEDPRADIRLLPRETLYRQAGEEASWQVYREGAWVPSEGPGAPGEGDGFGELPERLQVSSEARGATYLLEHHFEDQFLRRAHTLQEMHAGWAMRRQASERLVTSLAGTFLLTYIVATLLALGAGLLVVVPTSTRIEQLTRVAEEIREGHEEIRIARTGGGEVGRLAMAFNTMLDRLAESRKVASRMERLAAWRELARILAHEIKNPLTPIQLSVQQLSDSDPGTDERFSSLLATTREIVDEEIESLRSLVREFGDFARAPRLELSSAEPTAIARELGELYGARLQVHAPRSLPPLRLDREKMKRALINLLDNALAAAGEDGTLRLTVEKHAATLRYTVEDDGLGVPEEKRETIFEPHVTTKRTGMGLGLPIVRTVVQQHGGTITVDDSPALGGARFVITLPEDAEASA